MNRAGRSSRRLGVALIFVLFTTGLPTVALQPARATGGVQLLQPSVIHSYGPELEWTEYTGTDPLGAYEIYRSRSPIGTPSAQDLITSIADGNVTSFTDTTAGPGTFYYGVVAAGVLSNVITVSVPSDGTSKLTLRPNEDSAKDTYISTTSSSSCFTAGAASALKVGTASRNGGAVGSR